MEIYYSLILHHNRRRLGIQSAFVIFSGPIWIAAHFRKVDVKVGLAFTASSIEYLVHASFDTPLVESSLHEQDRGSPMDTDHWVDPVQDFYIIVLGEGILSSSR